MATYLRLLSILLVLSIVGDILHIKDIWFGGAQENGNSLDNLKYSLILPGAESTVSISYDRLLNLLSIKALKKLEKAIAKQKGLARKKKKQQEGNEGHTKNKRPSTKDKHEKGEARRQKDQNRKNENKQG